MADSAEPPKLRRSIGARRNPATEAAILAAARDLIAERGYAGFSIEEVARRAGAGKPTIYRWWPTKADLFLTIYRAEKASTIVIPGRGDLVLDLTDYTLALWRFWRTNPAGVAFRALVAEAQADAQALVLLRDRFLPERRVPMRALLTAAAERGEISPDDIDRRVTLWIAFIWYRLLTATLAEDRDEVAAYMRLIVGRIEPR
ncbi:TetR/AcrR family transcriptional regulator [Blastochloris tepida]|uniref:TetR family transcriptional regulator n=1 Tax=Blastochloris tepida TaxID=2233851 RepID=A0A348G0P0_9HYPH|nr:TetR/AcrR family transcriptional regulator [Blastochloris tepida]BBF93123.1 TetR family transcriptional regulator [Blastochloris tepida]